MDIKSQAYIEVKCRLNVIGSLTLVSLKLYIIGVFLRFPNEPLKFKIIAQIILGYHSVGVYIHL